MLFFYLLSKDCFYCILVCLCVCLCNFILIGIILKYIVLECWRKELINFLIFRKIIVLLFFLLRILLGVLFVNKLYFLLYFVVMGYF